MANESKLSDFGLETLADMKAAGANVPVFVPGLTNKRIPASEIAGMADLEASIGVIKDGGNLEDGATISVPNNAISHLTTSIYAHDITLNVDAQDENEVLNFAVEIQAGSDATITITKTYTTSGTDENNTYWEEEIVQTMCYSADAGNQIEAGKFYQITCVGSCWTLAEFVRPVVSEPDPGGEA
ncbi:MAG: hypothetical protein J6U20_03800 [Fibrobacter sp.]|nr:hypothetical protein [Fibrobacter sp.]